MADPPAWHHALRRLVLAQAHGNLPLEQCSVLLHEVPHLWVEQDMEQQQMHHERHPQLPPEMPPCPSEQQIISATEVFTVRKQRVYVTVTREHVEQLMRYIQGQFQEYGGSEQHLTADWLLAEASAPTAPKVSGWLVDKPRSYLNLPSPNDIPALRQILDLLARIDAFVLAYATSRSIRTLASLQQLLCSELNVTQYSDLGVGALSGHPLVLKVFTPPTGNPCLPAIPAVTEQQVAQELWGLVLKQPAEAVFAARTVEEKEQAVTARFHPGVGGTSKQQGKKKQKHKQHVDHQQHHQQALWLAQQEQQGRGSGSGVGLQPPAPQPFWPPSGVAPQDPLIRQRWLNASTFWEDKLAAALNTRFSVQNPQQVGVVFSNLLPVVAFMQKGKVTAQGTVDGIIQRHAPLALRSQRELTAQQAQREKQAQVVLEIMGLTHEPVILFSGGLRRERQDESLRTILDLQEGDRPTFDMLMAHFAITMKQFMAAAAVNPGPAFFEHVGKVMSLTYMGPLVPYPSKNYTTHTKMRIEVRRKRLTEFWEQDLLAQMLLRLVYVSFAGRLGELPDTHAVLGAKAENMKKLVAGLRKQPGTEDGRSDKEAAKGPSSKQRKRADRSVIVISDTEEGKSETGDDSMSDQGDEDEGGNVGTKRGAGRMNDQQPSKRRKLDSGAVEHAQVEQEDDDDSDGADDEEPVEMVAEAFCHLQRTLHENRPKGEGWSARLLKALKARVDHQLGFAPSKMQALKVFLDYMVKPQPIRGSSRGAAGTHGTAAAPPPPPPPAPLDKQQQQQQQQQQQKQQEVLGGLERPADVHVSWADLRQAASQLSQGTSLLDLAQLESRLAAHFHAPSFTCLVLPGRPISLLAAAAMDQSLATLLTHGTHTSSDNPLPLQAGVGASAVQQVPVLQDVLRVTAQAVCALGGAEWPEKLQAVQQGSTASHTQAPAEPPRPGVLPATAAPVVVPSAALHQLCSCLCKHFGVPHVEALGHGGAANLLRLLSLPQHAHLRAAASRSAIHSAVALSLQPLDTAHTAPTAAAAPATNAVNPGAMAWEGAGSGEGSASVVGLAGEVSRGMAVAVLAAAPPLADLHAWSCWAEVFAPSLGPLEHFLAEAGSEAGVAGLSLPPGPGPVLALPHGRLVRLAAVPTMEQWVDALLRADARQAAYAAVSLMAAHGGVACAPLALMASHAASCLEALAAEAGGGSQEATQVPSGAPQAWLPASAGAQRVARFMCGVLCCVPQPLLAHLVPTLLLGPLAQVVGSTHVAHTLLLETARAQVSHGAVNNSRVSRDPELCHVARSALHHLGFSLGITPWQDDWFALAREQQATLQKQQQQEHQQHQQQEQEQAQQQMQQQKQKQETKQRQQQGQQDVAQHVAELSMCTAESTDLPEYIPFESGTPTATRQAPTARKEDDLVKLEQQVAVAVTIALPDSAKRQAAGSNASLELDTATLCKQQAAELEAKGRAVVEAIRLDEFGLGLAVDGAGARLREVQNARMGRALERLSHELYSKDTHFVLELVQNADDNSYAADVVPTLEFVLREGCVTVLNNEVGFSEANLRALCDVGRSTKSRALGYIGQKGIGFKSVFRVSDQPEIHSGGFHVTFDLKAHKALGYILPTWVASHAPTGTGAATGVGVQHQGFLLATSSGKATGGADCGQGTAGQALALGGDSECLERAATYIVLPLKQSLTGAGGMGAGSGSAMMHKFEDVQPQLLLFLQRLRRLVVTRESEGWCDVMERHQLTEHVVELRVTRMQRKNKEQHSSTATMDMDVPEAAHSGPVVEVVQRQGLSQRWLIIRSTISPSLPRLDTEVPETQVCLAWCLGAAGSPSCTAASGPQGTSAAAAGLEPPCGPQRPAQQPVYAYLPLRSYGMRFVVQADWVVPSSREAVDADNAWNQALRSELPAIIAGALPVFRSLAGSAGEGHEHEHIRCVQWVDMWLSSLPLDGEAQGFLSSLPRAISARLQATPCIPTASGAWVTPRQALVCSSPAVASLLAQAATSMQPAHASHMAASSEALGAAATSAAASGEMATGVANVVAENAQLCELLGGQPVHAGLRSVAGSPALRALLGVREYTPARLIELAQAVCQQGLQSTMGPQWIAQLLLCILDPPDSPPHTQLSTGPSHMQQSNAHGDMQRARLLRAVQALPLMLLSDGTYAAARPPTPTQTLATDASVVTATADCSVPGDEGHVGQHHHVFFLPDPATQTASQVLGALSSCGLGPVANLTGLRFLHPDFASIGTAALAEAGNAIVQRKWHSCLQELGVGELRSEDILWQHVLPALQHASSRPTSSKRLAALLAYPLQAGLVLPGRVGASQGTQQQHAMLNALRRHAVLATNRGSVRATAPQPAALQHTAATAQQQSSTAAQPAADKAPVVYFPQQLGGALDLSQGLTMYGTWHVLDTAYIQEPQQQLQNAPGSDTPAPSAWPALSAWRWLLGELGVVDMPPLLTCTVMLRSPADLAGSIWRDDPQLRAMVAAGGGPWEVVDQCSPDLQGLITGLARDSVGSAVGRAQAARQKLAALAVVVSQHWKEHYQPAMQATCRPAAAHATLAGTSSSGHAVDSSLAHVLRTTAWLPSVSGAWCQPGKLFLPCSETQALLGKHVHYLDLPNASLCPSMARDLGLQMQVTAKHVIDMLITWCVSAPAATKLHGPQATPGDPTLPHLIRVYEFLLAACQKAEDGFATQEMVVTAFQKHPLVWLPVPGSTGTQGVLSAAAATPGAWHKCNTVVWSDPALVLETAAQLQQHTQHLARVKTVNQLPPLPRPLNVWYPDSLRHLFVEVLAQQPAASSCVTAAGVAGVPLMPTLDQYCHVLQRLPSCTDVAQATALARHMLGFLADQQAAGLLQPQHLATLHTCLASAALMPAKCPSDTNGTLHNATAVSNVWATLGEATLMADDPALARLILDQQEQQQKQKQLKKRSEDSSSSAAMPALIDLGTLASSELLQLTSLCMNTASLPEQLPASKMLSVRPTPSVHWLPVQQQQQSPGLAGGGGLKLGRLLHSLGLRPLSHALQQHTRGQVLGPEVQQLVPGLAERALRETSSAQDTLQGAQPGTLSREHMAQCLHANQLLQDVLPAAQAFLAHAGKGNQQLYSACQDLAAPLMSSLKVVLASDIQRTWNIPTRQPAAHTTSAAAATGTTTAAPAAGGVLCPLLPWSPATVVLHQGVLLVSPEALNDHMQLAMELSRVFTGGRAALPGLADLVYTCLLASTAGQPLERVLALKGIAAETGLSAWQLPSAGAAMARLQAALDTPPPPPPSLPALHYLASDNLTPGTHEFNGEQTQQERLPDEHPGQLPPHLQGLDANGRDAGFSFGNAGPEQSQHQSLFWQQGQHSHQHQQHQQLLPPTWPHWSHTQLAQRHHHNRSGPTHAGMRRSRDTWEADQHAPAHNGVENGTPAARPRLVEPWPPLPSPPPLPPPLTPPGAPPLPPLLPPPPPHIALTGSQPPLLPAPPPKLESNPSYRSHNPLHDETSAPKHNRPWLDPSAVLGSTVHETHVPSSITDKMSSAARYMPSHAAKTTNPGAAKHHTEATGRWGEELMLHWLTDKYRGTEPPVTVEWVNQHQETGKPYDLVIRRQDGSIWIYVEVKSSTLTAKDVFEISPNEWAMADKKRECYHLYRVSGALGSAPRVTELMDPIGAWHRKEVQLCLLI